MVSAFEMLGQKEFELATLRSEYAKLLDLLARVASGEIATDRVTVDVASQSWSFAAPKIVEPAALAMTGPPEGTEERRLWLIEEIKRIKKGNSTMKEFIRAADVPLCDAAEEIEIAPVPANGEA